MNYRSLFLLTVASCSFYACEVQAVCSMQEMQRAGANEKELCAALQRGMDDLMREVHDARLSIVLYRAKDETDDNPHWERTRSGLKEVAAKLDAVDNTWVDHLRSVMRDVHTYRSGEQGVVGGQVSMALGDGDNNGCCCPPESARSLHEDEINVACVQIDFHQGRACDDSSHWRGLVAQFIETIEMMHTNPDADKIEKQIDDLCELLRECRVRSKAVDIPVRAEVEVRFGTGDPSQCCNDSCNCAKKYRGNCPCAVMEGCCCGESDEPMKIDA